VSIGSLEPQFYTLLLEKCGLADDPYFKGQMNPKNWLRLKVKMTEVFKTRTRDEWCQIMEGSDVCFAPVLSMAEAAEHPHNKARETFVEIDGVLQPAPAPRFSRTPAKAHGPESRKNEEAEKIMSDWGVATEAITALKQDNVIYG
jgi:alpha-methylacyl-CoA racemase